jgi:hypothetical protein
MNSVFDINEIKVNENGDWDLSQSVGGVDAINQNIRVRLNELYGNCFFNTEGGIDVQTIADKGENEVESSIRKIIQDTAGVKSIVILSSNKTNGKLTLKYIFDTIYSTVNEITITV